MKFRKQNFRELERENRVKRSNAIELSYGAVSRGWCSIGRGVTITLVMERGKSQVRKSLKTRGGRLVEVIWRRKAKR